MVDEIFDRNYQQGRAELHAGLASAFGRIASSVSNTLKALHRVEWSAPWARNSNDAQCG